MKLVLLVAFLLTGIAFAYQLRDIFRDKQVANYYRADTYRDFRIKKESGVIKNPLDLILDQVAFTGKHSVQTIFTMIIILIAIGALLGFLFKNILIGVLAATFLGILPAFHMLKLERKRVFLITQTLSTFLAGLKTEYQLKGRLKDSFIAMESRVSELIKADYIIFVSELDQNVDLHEALYRLAERTKCIWFSHLGDIAEIAATRSNKDGLLRTLDDLSIEIERYTREASQNLQSIQRAGIYVLVMLAILGCSIFVTAKYIEQPLNYFIKVEQGRKHLTIGVLFLMLPILTYYYRVVRGGDKMSLGILLLILAIAFLPHIDSDKLYRYLSQWVSKLSPELIKSIEGVVARTGYTRAWGKYLLLWFVLGFPLGFLYFFFAVKLGVYSFGVHFLLSFSFFLGYLVLHFLGRRRERLIQADIRAVYRALKLVMRAGGSGEDALRKAIKYTKVLHKPLEGVLINWGEANYELLKLRTKFKGVDMENLVAYLLEVKKGISQGLIDNIERQEQQMVFENGNTQAKANQLDDDIAQVTFSLFLLSQVYLVVMPLINENVRTFQNF